MIHRCILNWFRPFRIVYIYCKELRNKLYTTVKKCCYTVAPGEPPYVGCQYLARYPPFLESSVSASRGLKSAPVEVCLVLYQCR